MRSEVDVSRHRNAVEFADGVYWIGALDPALRPFDIILSTASGTTCNAYLIRGSEGGAVVDTVKENFSDEFFARLESEAGYGEIKYITRAAVRFVHHQRRRGQAGVDFADLAGTNDQQR